MKNLLKNSANDFSNMFKKASNSRGANMATRKQAAYIQNAIDSARERISKALATTGRAGQEGGRRTRRRRSTRGRK